MAGFNPKSLANLKKFDSDTARVLQKKSAAARKTNKEIRDMFKLTATNFKAVMEDLPHMSSLDVLKMAMIKALQDDNYEDAARYAAQLAEYEKPKLQRIDQNVTTSASELSDEELQRRIKEEGLSPIGTD